MAETQVRPVVGLLLEIAALRLTVKKLERESAALRERLDRLESPPCGMANAWRCSDDAL